MTDRSGKPPLHSPQETPPPVLLDASRGGVAVITLNRPDKRNAFNAEVIERLIDYFDELRGADGIRAVLIEGAGSHFSAGADIDWMRHAGEQTRDDNVTDAEALAEMLRHLYELPKPTIALVQGAAIGGGLGLVAACDIAVAVRGSTFRFSEAALGLTPATISPFVVNAIGPRAAKALFVTARPFDADEAFRLGLIHEVLDSDADLTEAAERIVKQIYTAAPGAVADAKALVDGVAGKEISQALSRWTAERIADRRASDEGRDGLAAFLEKRKPAWAD